MELANRSGAWSKPQPRRRTRAQQEALLGLLFISPWLIGFILLKAIPILAALVFSLTDFKMLSRETTRFVGLDNYIRFLSDSIAGASRFRTRAGPRFPRPDPCLQRWRQAGLKGTQVEPGGFF